MKKVINSVFKRISIAAIIVLFSTQAYAVSLPMLDFGGVFSWDGTTVAGTGNSLYVVNRDGVASTTDAIVGNTVSLSVNATTKSGTLSIANWFDADIVFADELDPSSNSHLLAFLDNITLIGAGVGSDWWDEFSATISPANAHDGQLNLDFTDIGLGTLFFVDGKVSPVPEPATLVLLGLGLVGLGFFGRRQNG